MAAEWELLRGLFEGALERPAEERAAFLDEHTRHDPGLRREIESLLAAHSARRRPGAVTPGGLAALPL